METLLTIWKDEPLTVQELITCLAQMGLEVQIIEDEHMYTTLRIVQKE